MSSSSIHFLRFIYYEKNLYAFLSLSFAWFDNIFCKVQTVLVSCFRIIFISVTLKPSSTLLYKVTLGITRWHINS